MRFEDFDEHSFSSNSTIVDRSEKMRSALEQKTTRFISTLLRKKTTARILFSTFQAMLQYRGGGGKSPSNFAECAYLHRGLREDLAAQLPQGDDRPIEHVVFVVHGIGPIYNMRGEGLISCVNDMR